MKFGQAKEHNKRKFFFKNHWKNEAGRLVPNFFYAKALCEVKANGLQLNVNYFDVRQLDMQ